MLAKKHRLTLADPLVRALFRVGRRWRGRFFPAYFDFQGELPAVGIVVSKSLIPLASDRATVRRALYDAVGAHLSSVENLRLVLRVHSKDIANNREVLDKEIAALFEEIRHAKHG